MEQTQGRHAADAWTVHRHGEAQVMAAVLLVAEGRAPSVVVSNIAEADHVVAALTGYARALGVALELLRRADGRGHDVRACPIVAGGVAG